MFVTSYKEDFTWPESSKCNIKKSLKDVNETPPFLRPIPIYRNNETLMQFTEDNLPPFDLLLKRKLTDQTETLTPNLIEELQKKDGKVQLTRPRVYKAPEISLDDIKDPEMRQQIINYMYSTTWGVASSEIEQKTRTCEISNAKQDFPDHASQAIFTKKGESGDTMCEESTDEILNKWDQKQSRTLGNATSYFWNEYRAKKLLNALEDPIADSESTASIENILRLASENDLRFPFTLKPIGYAGFKPDYPIGIEPKKTKLKFSDPMLTSYQISNRWREE